MARRRARARRGSKRYINPTNVRAYLPARSRFYSLHAIQALKTDPICIAAPLLRAGRSIVRPVTRFIFVTGVISKSNGYLARASAARYQPGIVKGNVKHGDGGRILPAGNAIYT
jgi:hypothetical protein